MESIHPPKHHARSGLKELRGLIAEYLTMAAVLVALWVYFGATSSNFLTVGNQIVILQQSTSAILIAVGMTFVLVIAGIDLSVGSVLALSGALLGVLLGRYGWPLWAAVGAALGAGVLCGLFNGLISVRWRLPSFIVTLGMMEMARGGAHLITGSVTQPAAEAAVLYKSALFGVPVPILLALATVLVGQFVLSRTVFGRYMVAVGTNEEALRLTGIDPRPIKVAVFGITGLLVALAAVIDTAHFRNASPTAGNGYELAAIAAVVVGGTSLMGGRGSVINSFFGVLIIAVLSSGLAARGVSDEYKRLVTGLVIILAVILDHYRHRLGRR